jgi:DNA-3-methyladenine glycosylase
MRMENDVFDQDVLIVAPRLLGAALVRQFEDGRIERKQITEVEAYRGEEDLACHARRGKTKRTEVMYGAAGKAYVYLIYGMHWMLNVVTGKKEEPQAVLIRSVEGVCGPGRVGKWLQLDRSFYGEDIVSSQRIWFEEYRILNKKYRIKQTTRIGVDYAGEWAAKPWRYVLEG